ncbi:hypothetical protein QBC36DRAFT_338791 [Triangularia setosa]|uniref:Putative gamma-glutamylcyclotransferase n=1 Tax=Triangularia setosa TaxID=2587417 RepID=A0AAN6VYA8_9PEZI|nr:hypothetical protein QBC36DRAFT_338791 [Podospora setosa]
MPNSPPPPPPPPPLPPQPKTSSNYTSQLASMPSDYLTNLPSPLSEELLTAYEPAYFFFYGTLTQPHILKSVLNLPEHSEPVFLPAFITGYKLANWGQYKALINGDSTVLGKVYLIESREHQDRLSYYETNAYEIRSCRIEVEEPGKKKREIYGKTFMYAGDGEALKEGKFDRALWEKRMGVRLPEGFSKGLGAL